ncbi:MAG: hypothetical protein A2Y15_06120 [Clostridiales bacterium GWF2_36_10]|nr:MAG: hypothetical protein A2Y15_06120 [Clostridiales bacterium GWF2_36_10]HAN21908.1 hypothetical protein [Clostridiales bacterium]
MKKAIKITCIILAIIITVVIVTTIIIVVFFPGLPYYILTKIQCGVIDNTLQEFKYYDYKNKENTKLVSVDDYEINIKSKCELLSEDDENILYEAKNEFAVIIFKSPLDFYVMFKDIDKEKYKDIYGINSDNFFELSKLMLSIDYDDFDFQDYNKSVILFTLAAQREIAYGFEEKCYLYEKDNIKGFILESEKMLVFQFYNTENLNEQYQIVFTKFNDKKVLYDMINTIVLKN